MHDYNFSERVSAVFERARTEAAARGHAYVGAEHMLIALIQEHVGAVRAETLRLLGTSDRPAPHTASAKSVAAVVVEIGFADGSVERAELPSVGAAAGFLALPR